jgi:hypothetical protein
MQINTKFNIGDSVVFLHRDCFMRRVVSRIEIESSAQDDKSIVVIRYFFLDIERIGPIYKYESEIAATKEELAKMSKEY